MVRRGPTKNLLKYDATLGGRFLRLAVKKKKTGKAETDRLIVQRVVCQNAAARLTDTHTHTHTKHTHTNLAIQKDSRNHK